MKYLTVISYLLIVAMAICCFAVLVWLGHPFMAFLTILFIPRIKFKWEDDHGKD